MVSSEVFIVADLKNKKLSSLHIFLRILVTMGSMGNFADEFWNTEICDFSGWNTINQRVKDGNKITSNYIDLLKQVTSAMENFGKSLLKASKNSSLPDKEHGKVKNALQTARQSVEAWGQDSLDAAAALTGQINILSQHLNQAKETRKRTDDEVKNRQNNLQDAVRRVKQAKKTAQTKFRDKKNCENQRFQIESKSDAKPKDVEKALLAEKKAEDAIAEAEEQHRESVVKNNQSLQDWKNTTHASLKIMQDVEEARVKVIRDSMWTVANICSLLAVHCDNHHETIRVSLLSVDVGQELSTWVSLFRTLQGPPKPMIYKPQDADSHLSTPLSTPAHSKRSTVADADSSNDDSWSESGSPEPLCDATALFEFSPRSESEVSLKVGEKVSVLDKSNAEWAFIRKHAGESGFVPASFISAVIPNLYTLEEPQL